MSQEPSSATSLDDITTVEETLAEINALESLAGGLTEVDEYSQAILRNQALSLRLQLEQQRGALPEAVNLRGGTRRLVPRGSVGIANGTIYENDTGKATFQINGTIFITTVEADEDIDSAALVEVIDGENTVEETDGSGFGRLTGGGSDSFVYEGRFRSIPSVVDPENDLKVENQLYNDGDYTTVTGDLGPGQEKEFARIEVANDEFLLFKYTNATAAQTVRYNYYVDGPNDPDPDLSGSSPLASPPERYEVIPDGYMIVDNSVSLVIEETSGSNSYSGLSGLLTGIKLEV